MQKEINYKDLIMKIDSVLIAEKDGLLLCKNKKTSLSS